MCVMTEDAQGGEQVAELSEDVPEDEEAEEYEEGVVLHGLNEEIQGSGDVIPLPDMTGGKDDRINVIKEQEEDNTLREIRQWATQGKNGYFVDDGLLIHHLTTPTEQVQKRIVVPSGRRNDLLRLAHSSLLGGHFPHTKTTHFLNRKFTWPGMTVDVKRMCRQCALCQKAGRPSVDKLHLNLCLLWTCHFRN